LSRAESIRKKSSLRSKEEEKEDPREKLLEIERRKMMEKGDKA